MSRGRRLAVLWAVTILVSVAGASLIVLTDAGEPVGGDPERCCRDRFALIKDIEDAIVAIDEGQLNEASEILKSAIRNVE